MRTTIKIHCLKHWSKHNIENRLLPMHRVFNTYDVLVQFNVVYLMWLLQVTLLSTEWLAIHSMVSMQKVLKPRFLLPRNINQHFRFIASAVSVNSLSICFLCLQLNIRIPYNMLITAPGSFGMFPFRCIGFFSQNYYKQRLWVFFRGKFTFLSQVLNWPRNDLSDSYETLNCHAFKTHLHDASIRNSLSGHVLCNAANRLVLLNGSQRKCQISLISN